MSNQPIKLKLIYVNCGEKSKEFLVPFSSTAIQVANHVFNNWPDEWQAEKVDRPEILRLIYQGKFLHENVTLNSLNIKSGKTTVMHLIPREKLPESTSAELDREKEDIQAGDTTGCCVCTIV